MNSNEDNNAILRALLLSDGGLARRSGQRCPYVCISLSDIRRGLLCLGLPGDERTGRGGTAKVNAIETELPYEQYSDAALVFAMRQAGGEGAALYRDTVAMKEIADRFIRAQTRANRQCFGRDGPPAK
jgi:hypothetical protein